MYPYFKRIFDFIASFFGLLLLSPVLLIISIIVLIKHGHPILFTQKRPGKNEQIFKMFKFRTMTNERDEHGVLLPDKKRLTKFGSFLRKTSLDELPELINVIKGDMSLIGPRPLLIKYLPYYTTKEKKRHDVRPGITGLAQISGRNFLNWDKRLSTDVKYVENLSLKLDINIFIQTISCVISMKDVSVNSDEVELSFIDYRTNKLTKKS